MSNNLGSQQSDLLLEYDKIDSVIRGIQEQIKPMQIQLKDYKTKRNILKENLLKDISTSIQVSEAMTCNLPDVSYREPSAIKFSKVEVSRPITQSIIKENILKFFRGHMDEDFLELTPVEKTNHFYEFITSKDNREKTIKLGLKRVKKPKNKTTKINVVAKDEDSENEEE